MDDPDDECSSGEGEDLTDYDSDWLEKPLSLPAESGDEAGADEAEEPEESEAEQ